MIVVQSPHVYGSLHGLLLTPVMFVIMEVEIVIDGLGIPIPAWSQSHFRDCSACYQLNIAAESFLNTTVCCADKIASDGQPITWYWSVYGYIMMAAFILMIDQ